MDTERLLDVGELGIHLLFETETITEAFGQDADRLRSEISGRYEEIEFAIRHVLNLPSARQARRYIQDLAPALRHILVLLYFEMLDGRLRDNPRLQ